MSVYQKIIFWNHHAPSLSAFPPAFPMPRGSSQWVGTANIRSVLDLVSDQWNNNSVLIFGCPTHYYPMVNTQKTMENHYAIDGKTHYFDWTIFNSYVIPDMNNVAMEKYHVQMCCSQLEISVSFGDFPATLDCPRVSLVSH